MSAEACRCGRLKGLSMEALAKKGTGCQTRYVCPRLDQARRTHPKFNEWQGRHRAGVIA
jgi:hypothetical protein